jgi:hypothetical protein
MSASSCGDTRDVCGARMVSMAAPRFDSTSVSGSTLPPLGSHLCNLSLLWWRLPLTRSPRMGSGWFKGRKVETRLA